MSIATIRTRSSGPARGRWLRTTLAVLIGCVALKLLGWGSVPVEVVVDIRTEAGTDGELFYAGDGQEHHPDRRIPFALAADGQWHTYRIAVPGRTGLDRIRIDPGSLAGPIEIKSLGVETGGSRVRLEGSALSAAQVGVHMLAQQPGASSSLRFVATAPDPYVEFKLPGQRMGGLIVGWAMPWLQAAAVIALLWLTLGEWIRTGVVRLGGATLPKPVHVLADCLSDPAALIVPARAIVVVLALMSGAVLYVSLNLHQSSIGVWEQLFSAAPIEQTIDLGSPRQIRSDEWNTQTPWVLGQVIRGNHVRNPSVGGEYAPLLAAVPVSHSSAIAQVKFFGFYLFDAETGFSWWWAYKTFGLLLSFFWLFLLLTRGDVAASAIGTAWVYGSSVTQWWFSSNLPELLTAFGLATIGGIYLLFARRRLMIAIGALLIAYGVLNLLLHLYPAFILPLAYLGVAVLLGTTLEPGRIALMQCDSKWRAACLTGAVAIVGVVGGNYLLDAMPTIQVMANTLYPGHRIATSGDMTAARMLYGFFEVFRVGENRLPLPPTNASEASSFVILVPLLLLAMPFTALAKRRNALVSVLAVYCLVVGLWICTRLPSPIENVMQALGWSWAPPIRSILGLGVGSIMAVTLFFSRIRGGQIDTRGVVVRRGIPVVVFLAVAAFGWSLQGIDPGFFSNEVIVVAALATGLIAAGVVLGRTMWFGAGLAVLVLPAMMVNPLVSGLSSIDENPVLVAARRQSAIDSDRWAVVGAFVLSQGLKSQGLEVITGSQMIPEEEVTKVLDPSSKFAAVWNRYAHVMIRSEPEREAPEYELISPDLYEIGMNICGPELRQLGVTRIAYTQPVPAADADCLLPLYAPADSGVSLFRLLPDPTPTSR